MIVSWLYKEFNFTLASHVNMSFFRSRTKDSSVISPIPKRSPEERDLVRRLDIFLMTFGCISQVIKSLDQQNINNAYVSGMQEDLHLYGDQLNYFTTAFNVTLHYAHTVTNNLDVGSTVVLAAWIGDRMGNHDWIDGHGDECEAGVHHSSVFGIHSLIPSLGRCRANSRTGSV